MERHDPDCLISRSLYHLHQITVVTVSGRWERRSPVDMSTNRFSALVWGCIVVVITTFGSRVEAQTCPCEGHMWNNISAETCPTPPNIKQFVSISDVINAIECAIGVLDPGGPASHCPNASAALQRCDVDCDGDADWCDVGQVYMLWLGWQTCSWPCGACCQNEILTAPNCIVTTQGFCSDGIILQNAIYLGNGATCNPNPCDCQPNGILDEQDILNGNSFDVNNNGLPDECESGGCCFILEAGKCAAGPELGQPCSSNADCSGSTCPSVTTASCTLLTQVECEDPARNGVYSGPQTWCPNQNVKFVDEGDGTVFAHVVGPAVECSQPGQPMMMSVTQQNECAGPPYNDFWVSSSDGSMCENFGTPENPPIPADFFGSGSDPFVGQLCLRGVPLEIPGAGDTDTQIERVDDPFEKCTLPSGTSVSVDIEIVAMSLESVSPITVTFNGGQDPELWDTTVDLSPGGLIPGTPQSTLTATKTHCNGGTYISTLYVQPRFTFTKTGGGGEETFDTGLFGLAPIQLNQNVNAAWVTEVDEDAIALVDNCSKFHPGFEELLAITDCDCNENLQWDRCDIDTHESPDCNSNLRPDECEIADGTFVACVITIPLPPLPDPYSPGTLACGGGDNYGLPCLTCDSGSRVGLTCMDSFGCPNGNCVPNDSLCQGASCGGTIAGGGAFTFTYPKSRFIGFAAPDDPSWTGQEVAVRVTLDNIGPNAACNDQIRYAGEPVHFCEGGACSTMFWASQLQTIPHWMDWTTVGTVQLYGEEVAPGSRYLIQAVDKSSDGNLTNNANFSVPPLKVDTAKWGDVVTPLSGFTTATQPSISDVLNVVDKWLGFLEPRKSRAQLQPADLSPKSNVGIADVLKDVDAWLGTPYPFTITTCIP